MLFVVCHLLLATSVGLIDGLLHGLSNGLSIHDGKSMNIAGSTSYNLNERAMVAQKSLIVSIEDGYEGHFRKVQSFAQEVNANEHVVGAGAEIVDDIDTIESVNIGMDVIGLDTHAVKEGGHFLCLALGGGDDQRTLPHFVALMDLLDEVVHEVELGTHLDGRVEQSCGTNELFDNDTLSTFQFILGRRG